jgi:hypothetical protein
MVAWVAGGCGTLVVNSTIAEKGGFADANVLWCDVRYTMCDVRGGLLN